MTRKLLLLSLAITLLSLLVVIAFQAPLSSVEDQATALKYQIRGSREADSNIVIIYIDNDAIRDLGWPVRRNFYALMVSALSDLQVKAIGIDVVFEEPNREYPEYDELFGSTIHNSRRVVLSSYFRSLSTRTEAPGQQGDPAKSFPRVVRLHQHGREFHQPLNVLRTQAAGIGHLNLAEGTDVPIFIQSAEGVVPSFGLELVRVFKGISGKDVVLNSESVRIGDDITFPVGSEGVVHLNFPGPINSFRAYPFLEVLKSYDDMRMHRSSTIPVGLFKDKLVLISVVAEGRSIYLSTPVAARYPSIGLQATFIDNTLQSRFLVHPNRFIVYLLPLVLGFLCACAMILLRSPIDKVVAFSLPVLGVGTAILLFVAGTYDLPVMPFLIVCVLGILGSLIYKQQLVTVEVSKLQTEKGTVLSMLRQKELKVAQLENELLHATRSANRTNELLEEIRRYKAEIHSLSSSVNDMEEFTFDHDEVKSSAREFEGIVYDASGSMKPVIEFVGKIADNNAPVLILGESGTGKELVARAVHKRSPRVAGPFIAVNCGALSENLLESELFGHERGAFTGAVKDKLGRFELADNGTIFLDEIGEVTEAFQLKLLRVLQEGELERVGGTKTIKVNVRVIAATNKDLKEQVKVKRFREDLFYRLNVLMVSLPPMRERQDDIPLLIQHFLTRESADMRTSKNVMDALQAYSWPGNVRELESVIKRAVLLAKADGRTMMNVKDLTEEVAASAHGRIALEDQILESLREKGFSRSSVSDTAEELGGLSRGTVAEYLRGQCLKAFVEHGFNIVAAAEHVSLSTEAEVNDRVQKRVREYLSNIIEVANPSKPWEEVRIALKPKTKNLPQRYHGYVETIANAHYSGAMKKEVTA